MLFRPGAKFDGLSRRGLRGIRDPQPRERRREIIDAFHPALGLLAEDLLDRLNPQAVGAPASPPASTGLAARVPAILHLVGPVPRGPGLSVRGPAQRRGAPGSCVAAPGLGHLGRRLRPLRVPGAARRDRKRAGPHGVRARAEPSVCSPPRRGLRGRRASSNRPRRPGIVRRGRSGVACGGRSAAATRSRPNWTSSARPTWARRPSTTLGALLPVLRAHRRHHPFT